MLCFCYVGFDHLTQKAHLELHIGKEEWQHTTVNSTSASKWYCNKTSGNRQLLLNIPRHLSSEQWQKRAAKIPGQ